MFLPLVAVVVAVAVAVVVINLRCVSVVSSMGVLGLHQPARFGSVARSVVGYLFGL